MPYYRKKPVVIEARQLVGDNAQCFAVAEWVVENGYPWLLGNALDPKTLADVVGNTDKGIYIDPATGDLVIRTLEGDMHASYGWWIIKGIQGEFYPCDPEIFEGSYEYVAPVEPD